MSTRNFLRPRLSFYTFIFLSLLTSLSLFSFSVSASHESSSTRAVPLSELWEYYANLNPLSFSVKECGFDEFKGGYNTGDLAAAATQAAAAWEQAMPGIVINVRLSDCSLNPGFRNGENEIHWANYSNGSAELGDYKGFFLFSGELVEHDISVDSTALGEFVDRDRGERQTALFNLVVHELGHALGLGDAYLVDTRSCDWSVMLLQCTGPRKSPTAADIAALRHVHGFAAEPSSSPTPIPVPSPPPPDPVPPPAVEPPPPTELEKPFHMSQYDLNDNGVIDDEELFAAVDQWALGALTDDQLNMLIDAWISQIRVAAVKRRANSTTLTSIEIFDTSGKFIDRLECSMAAPQSRIARALDRARAPKGVYITAIRDCTTNILDVKNGLYQG